MEENFIDYLEAELARGLRCIDRAGMIAQYLREHPTPLQGEQASDRLREDVRRALTIRESIMAAGIELPALRKIGQREELLQNVDSPPIEGDLKISQIAKLAGVDRTTVMRWLQKMKGPIGEKYWRARGLGKPAVFTLKEAQEIIRGGE
ncbi:MAG: hypothetical protein ABSF77_19730 [Spirochaetia bacterium]|jgi:transcriptional regulator with XRE-family HTH domain